MRNTMAVSTGASIPLTVGAILASGAFGALTTPFDDPTITRMFHSFNIQ
ncbi:hypothetical protein [Cytobacillus oceanisediminis]|nr:hypothetical protein [Cytobacillus oceanisediminis]